MFVDVDPSDEGLRPSVNPQKTGDDGAYRWDVSEGRYRVVVTKSGYWRATSDAVSVPPPVLDLHVALKRRPGTVAPEPQNCGEPPEIDSTPGCVIRPARAWVRGNEIRKVVFFLDGRRIETDRRPDKKGRFGVLINRKQLSPGKHRVRARVVFKRSAHRRPATVRLILRRCIKSPAPERIATTRTPECTPFLAYLRGDSIKAVAYALDGDRLRTVRVADWKGRYGVKVDPRELASGAHTLTARVVFVDKSGLETRTLELPIAGCQSS
jgi:hypothetical protein